jgi:disulfide bond formation protein DsbB
MYYDVPAINQALGFATLLLNIATAALLAIFFLRRRVPSLAPVASFVGSWGLWFGFLLTLGGLGLSLFYSEILGFAPCSLCWVMRIFMYSQVVLFAMALWKRDRSIADYSIALSVFGIFVGLYQHYLQMGGAGVIPCPATLTEASDCAARFLFELGYITFPLMGVSLFAALIVTMFFVRAGRSAEGR